MLSNIMKPTPSVPKLLTHMLLEMDLAKPHLVPMILSELLDIPTVPESLPLHLPSNLDQSPLPLMPKTGHLIPEVSSPTVELLSITESYSPVILPALG